MKQITEQLTKAIADLQVHFPFERDHILVVGCSTSEVVGKKIGTAGTIEVADEIFRVLQGLQQQTGVQLAFQCCEHLNRALVVTKETAREARLTEVKVVPVHSAGGALASHAYQALPNAVIVENIQGDVGIDIGDTLIGMHLKAVAVPLRSTIKEIGQAHLTMAYTRPKLIGGNRAVYV